MPKTTEAPTREQIEAEVAAAEQRAAMLREQIWREDEAKRQRREEAQRSWDEEFVASISRQQLEADAEQARTDLHTALAENPLITALADYYSALRRRGRLVFEHNQALNRLGRPTVIPPSGMQTEMTAVELLELMLQTAERIATGRADVEFADLSASREAAAENAERQG